MLPGGCRIGDIGEFSGEYPPRRESAAYFTTLPGAISFFAHFTPGHAARKIVPAFRNYNPTRAEPSVESYFLPISPRV